MHVRHYKAPTRTKTLFTQPKEPTWSVKALTDLPEGAAESEEITLDRLAHLHKLAQLTMPENARQVEQLKDDINHIAHFIKHVKNAQIPPNTEPLASLWQGHIGQTLRPDEPMYTEDEVRGRDLLKHQWTLLCSPTDAAKCRGMNSGMQMGRGSPLFSKL
jgi:Asp-tRNA(Asn)/Glu-tRNA(Gln) amidotransferase C subunit